MLLSRVRRRSLIALTAACGVASAVLVSTAGVSAAAPPLTIEEVQVQLAALQTKQEAAAEAYNAGQIELEDAQNRVEAAKASEARQQTQVDAAAAQVAWLARAAYMGGTIDPVTGLLAGEGAQSAVDRVGALNQVARARSTAATSLSAEQTRLAALKKEREDQADVAARTQERLAQEKAAIDALTTQQAQVLERMQADQRRELEARQAAERAAAAAAAVKAQEAAAAAVAAAQAQQAAIKSAPSTSSPPSFGPPAAASNVAAVVLAAAYSQRGKPYLYAGAGPDSFDCSGLVMWAFAKAGISLPHNAAAQYNYGRRIPPSQLQPGDIVFFLEDGIIGHDGIYVGNGRMIDANHTGGWVDERSMVGYPTIVGGVRF